MQMLQKAKVSTGLKWIFPAWERIRSGSPFRVKEKLNSGTERNSHDRNENKGGFPELLHCLKQQTRALSKRSMPTVFSTSLLKSRLVTSSQAARLSRLTKEIKYK